MFELSIWSRRHVVNHPIPPSPPRSEINPRINSRMWHFLSSLPLPIYTEPAAASFLIRLHREERPASLHRSTDSSTTSSLPGLALPLPLWPNFPDVSGKVAERNGPALVVPRFDLIGLPTFSWQNRVSASVREARIAPPALSGGGSARLGTHRRRRRRCRRRRRAEKLSRDGEQSNPPRDSSASFQFSDVSSALSAEIDVPSSLRDAGEESGSSIAAGNRPGIGACLAFRRYCAEGPAFFFDTVMRMDLRDPRESWILDSFVKGILYFVGDWFGGWTWSADWTEFLFGTTLSITKWILILQDFKFQKKFNSNRLLIIFMVQEVVSR